jgi:hypothetical protein
MKHCYECGAPVFYRELCFQHYRDELATNPEFRRYKPRAGRVCSVVGCDKPVRASELCNQHYMSNYRNGTPQPQPKHILDHPDTCTLPDCDKPYHLMGMCRSHYDKKLRQRKAS